MSKFKIVDGQVIVDDVCLGTVEEVKALLDAPQEVSYDEPWKIRHNEDTETFLDNVGYCIARTISNAPNRKAAAARIVACVNALKDVPDWVLEAEGEYHVIDNDGDDRYGNAHNRTALGAWLLAEGLSKTDMMSFTIKKC